jgi:DNA-binding MarR family transcriptional regulator
MTTNQEDCARELLDVVPLVTRSIRREIRQHRAEGLSVPQFRTLLFLRRNPGASLIDVADHFAGRRPSGT